MPNPVTIPKPLEERLILSVQDLLRTPLADPTLDAARAVIQALAFKRREEDGDITPESESPKRARLIVTASDQGRYKITPVRIMRLEFIVRANAKVPAGQRDSFVSLAGALETLLDGLNLKNALTSASRGVGVMLAVRKPGNAHGIEGDIRTTSYALDVRAVGMEHTT